jgi:hypothetical protein
MKVAYISWRDACSEEADERNAAVVPGLAELHEVGFLLGETDEVVTIGMEQCLDGTSHPGRWRLHIPKSAIIFMKVVESEKTFAPGRKKRVK